MSSWYMFIIDVPAERFDIIVKNAAPTKPCANKNVLYVGQLVNRSLALQSRVGNHVMTNIHQSFNTILFWGGTCWLSFLQCANVFQT